VAIHVPNIEVNAESRRCTAQTHFYTADILGRFQLQVTDVIQLNTPYEFIVLLLLLADSA
jgi:hypothetical protein